jgi:Arc/MetJ-type ribon-helix-helix transcriptional regulator
MGRLSFLGKRTSFLFSPLASRQLDELGVRTRLSRDTDLLAAALDILAEMIEIVTAGGHILVKERKSNKVWAYSPYSPPRLYKHFSPVWSDQDDGGNKQRRSFSFDASMLKRVDQIRRASRFQSLSDVVRAAIAVLNELLAVEEARDQIILRDTAGRTRPYSVLSGPILSDARQASSRQDRSAKVVVDGRFGRVQPRRRAAGV